MDTDYRTDTIGRDTAYWLDLLKHTADAPIFSAGWKRSQDRGARRSTSEDDLLVLGAAPPGPQPGHQTRLQSAKAKAKAGGSSQGRACGMCSSARRPRERPASDEVEVQVEDALARGLAVVGHDAKVFEPLLRRPNAHEASWRERRRNPPVRPCGVHA